MKDQFEILKQMRELIHRKVADLTLEQLNKVPAGFNNNIAWNVGHLVVTQQLLHYALSENHCLVSNEMIAKYRKGTRPESDISSAEFEEIIELFLNLPERLVSDYDQGLFAGYKTYPTSTGIVLDSIEKAIAFNNVHEGIHLGSILALLKLV